MAECKKVKYKTVKEAKRVITYYKKTQLADMGVYKCSKCGYFHIGNNIGKEFRVRK